MKRSLDLDEANSMNLDADMLQWANIWNAKMLDYKTLHYVKSTTNI